MIDRYMESIQSAEKEKKHKFKIFSGRKSWWVVGRVHARIVDLDTI